MGLGRGQHSDPEGPGYKESFIVIKASKDNMLSKYNLLFVAWHLLTEFYFIECSQEMDFFKRA